MHVLLSILFLWAVFGALFCVFYVFGFFEDIDDCSESPPQSVGQRVFLILVGGPLVWVVGTAVTLFQLADKRWLIIDRAFGLCRYVSDFYNWLGTIGPKLP